MRELLAGISLFLLPILSLAGPSDELAAAGERPPRPHPDCMDARAVERVYPTSDWQLAAATLDGGRYRIELQEACPGLSAAGAELSLLSPSGWVCGSGPEYLRVEGSQRLCPIAAMAPAESGEFAALLSEAARVSGHPLDPVDVRARAVRGFRGSHDQCFAARQVRGWSESGDAIEVEVSARRSGGNARYRVTLGDMCPDLGRATSVGFRSGSGNGVICGNAGDVVELIDVGRIATSRLGSRCSIREVQPISQVAER